MVVNSKVYYIFEVKNILLIILFLVLICSAYCENYYFNSLEGGLWSNLKNWAIESQDSGKTPTSLPTNGDSIYIVLKGNYEVTYDVDTNENPVFEKIIIGSNEDEIFTVPNLMKQTLNLNSSLSVNSLIEISSTGSLVLSDPSVTIKGGAKLKCNHGGILLQKAGSIELIGDIEISGIYTLESGLVSGALDHNLIVTEGGVLRSFGSMVTNIQRNIKIIGLFDHSALGILNIEKELLIDNYGTLAINSKGVLNSNVARVKGSLEVNAESNIFGNLEIYGVGKIKKSLNIHENLLIHEDGILVIDYSYLICWKSCNINGVIEGSVQTQNNFISLKPGSEMNLYEESKVRGNLYFNIEQNGKLSTWSKNIDFTGKVEIDGELQIVKGKFKTNSFLVNGILITERISENNIDDTDIIGEVLVYGIFHHKHTSTINFHSTVTIEKNAILIWDGSGDIIGNGTLQILGKMNVVSSSTLGMSNVRNEGVINIVSSQFSIISESFVQEGSFSQILLNSTRLLLESNSKLNSGTIIVDNSQESNLVVSKDCTFETKIPLTGKLSLSIHGVLNLISFIDTSKNIDVFNDGLLNIINGNVNGIGQLLVHDSGKLRIDPSASITIEKVIIIAGEMQILGNIQMNNDITSLDGSTLICISESGKISGTGTLSNHGELRIQTSIPSDIDIPIINSGKFIIKSDVNFGNTLQQVDSVAEMILDNSIIKYKPNELIISDGTFIGIGTIFADVRFAGEYYSFLKDQLGTLKIEGSLHSSGTSVAKFKIKSKDKFSSIEVRDNIDLDGSTLDVEILDNLNLEGNNGVSLFKGRKVNGIFGEVNVIGTNEEPKVKYLRDEGKVIFQLKGGNDSSSSHLSFNFLALYTLILATIVILFL